MIPHSEKILGLIKKEEIVTSSEVAKFLKVSWNTADSYLKELLIEGKIKKKKKGGNNIVDKKVNFFNKKGQLTLWIVLAIVLLALVVLFFALNKNAEIVDPSSADESYDVDSYLSSCVAPYVEEAVSLMLPQGGFVNPKNTVFFNNTNIEYLCEHRGFYDPCINQHPMLLNEMKWEIEDYVAQRALGCFEAMQEEFESRGAEVRLEAGQPFVEVDLGPDIVKIYMKKKSTIIKYNETRKYSEYNLEIVSPLYNLASIASEIASQEARFCYFEFVGYSIIYPRYKISKYVMSKPVKIYTIHDKKSGKEMNVAIRGCAIPPGF